MNREKNASICLTAIAIKARWSKSVQTYSEQSYNEQNQVCCSTEESKKDM